MVVIFEMALLGFLFVCYCVLVLCVGCQDSLYHVGKSCGGGSGPRWRALNCIENKNKVHYNNKNFVRLKLIFAFFIFQ